MGHRFGSGGGAEWDGKGGGGVGGNLLEDIIEHRLSR